MNNQSGYPPPALLSTDLFGRYPRRSCGRPFSGDLALALQSSNCGLDFSFADSADGPAFFAMLRPLKGMFVALQCRHKAEEGRPGPSKE